MGPQMPRDPEFPTMFATGVGWSSMGNTKALSDCLVDALVAWGDAEAVAERMSEHRAADAAMRAHVLGGNRTSRVPRHTWRKLSIVSL